MSASLGVQVVSANAASCCVANMGSTVAQVCFGLRWEVCSKRLAIDPQGTPPEQSGFWGPKACPIVGGHFCQKKSACCKLESSNMSCQIRGWPISRKKTPAASWRAATGLFKSQAVIFTQEKAPAASWIAATGLVESRVVIFAGKKAPAASWVAATGLVKSQAAVFIQK